MSPLASYIVETALTLLAIVVLAALVLLAARKVGVGRGAGPLALVGRLPLDGRRTVYLVRAGEKVLILGASEAGLSKLGELGELGELPGPRSEGSPGKQSFRALLGHVLQRPAAPDASSKRPSASPPKALDDEAS